MRLYIMRHGPAEDHAATGRDEDRALTASGRDRVRDVARALAKHGELPGRLLTSRLVRAVQTAEIVAAALAAAGAPRTPETVHELAPGGKGIDLAARLARESITAMVVGHEPDLSSLLARLLGEPLSIPMDKAMVVALEVDAPGAPEATASLRFILEPRTLEILQDQRSR